PSDSALCAVTVIVVQDESQVTLSTVGALALLPSTCVSETLPVPIGFCAGRSSVTVIFVSDDVTIAPPAGFEDAMPGCVSTRNVIGPDSDENGTSVLSIAMTVAVYVSPSVSVAGEVTDVVFAS